MAYIQERKGQQETKYVVTARRRDTNSQSKSFSRKTEVKTWARHLSDIQDKLLNSSDCNRRESRSGPTVNGYMAALSSALGSGALNKRFDS